MRRYAFSKFRIVLLALLLGAIVFVTTGYAQPSGGPAKRALIGDGSHGGEMPQLGIGHGSQPSKEHRLLRSI